MAATRRLPAGTALTVAEVAAMSGKDDHEVRTAIDRRHLRARQVHGQWQVLVEDVRRWMTRH